MFFNGSRYERVKDYVAIDSRGNRNKVKRIRRIPTEYHPNKALTHIIKEGDRLDLLAYKYYGDPTKFWLICDANQSMFPYELLVPGKKIIIPKEGL